MNFDAGMLSAFAKIHGAQVHGRFASTHAPEEREGRKKEVWWAASLAAVDTVTFLAPEKAIFYF